MRWTDINELSASLPIPPGYHLEQLSRAGIPELVRCFKAWFPDISPGSESCYHREDFYEREVSLLGEPERDVIVHLIKKDRELVAMCSMERNLAAHSLYGRIGAVAPEHRGEKLGNIATTLLEAMGRAMGMALVYCIATLKHPYSQLMAESVEFQLVGIIPASDRYLVAPGVAKYVFEALYVKVLVADAEIARPKSECMTPSTRALFDFLFTSPGTAAAGTRAAA